MILHEIADKIRRAIRNRTGATFTAGQVKEIARCGILHELARLEADEYCRDAGVVTIKQETSLAPTTEALEALTDQVSPPNYSVRTLADRWGCSEGLIRKLIKEGKLRSSPYGSLIRISAAEVARYEAGKE